MENEIQQNIPPVQPLPQTPTTISSSTNWSKILLFTVLGLVVVAVAVFIGIQIGKNQITNRQPITDQSAISPTQTVVNPTALPTTLNPTANPTADWKTYINNKYKYEIKFPSLWEYNRGPGNISDAELSNQRDIDIYEPNLPSGNPGTGITIKVNKLDAQGISKNCTTLEDCIEKSFSWLPKTQEIEKGETIFLGQQAKTIKYTRITPLYSQTWKYVFVILNNNFYSFSLSSETKGFDKNLIIFNQNLSTFKFTN